MKRTALILLTMQFLCGPAAAAGISADAAHVKGDLVKAFGQNNAAKPVKIAVMNFDETTDDSKKARAGQVFSSALVQQFSSDRDFIVVERAKLEAVFKELRLNLSGAVDQKEVKRAGVILGVDWLVLGDISESDGKFLVQARIVNAETAQVAAAASVPVEKALLIKESEQFYETRVRNLFSVLVGNTKSPDLKFNGSHIGAELRHNLTNRQFVQVRVTKVTGENDEVYKTQKLQNCPFGTCSAEEKFTSFSSLSASYGLVQKLPLQTRFTAQAGAGMYILGSDQRFFSDTGGGTGSYIGGIYKLPGTNTTTYYAPGYELGAGLERNFGKSIVFGVEARYHGFSFKRKLDGGAENTWLTSEVKPLNKKISVSAVAWSAAVSFSF